MAKSPTKTKVKVIELSGVKLKPGQQYLFGFDTSKLSMDDAMQVIEGLHEKQIDCIMIGTLGDPREAVTFFQVPKPEEPPVPKPAALDAPPGDPAYD